MSAVTGPLTPSKTTLRLTATEGMAAAGLQDIAIALVERHAAGRGEDLPLPRRVVERDAGRHVVAGDCGDCEAFVGADTVGVVGRVDVALRIHRGARRKPVQALVTRSHGRVLRILRLDVFVRSSATRDERREHERGGH